MDFKDINKKMINTLQIDHKKIIPIKLTQYKIKTHKKTT